MVDFAHDLLWHSLCRSKPCSAFGKALTRRKCWDVAVWTFPSRRPVRHSDVEYEYGLCAPNEDAHTMILEATIFHHFHEGCCPASEDIVRGIPKRKKLLESQYGITAFGMHAQQGLAFSKFLVFFFGGLAGPFAFAIWYLTWNPWDLQNAFCLVFLMLGVISVLVLLPDLKIPWRSSVTGNDFQSKYWNKTLPATQPSATSYLSCPYEEATFTPTHSCPVRRLMSLIFWLPNGGRGSQSKHRPFASMQRTNFKQPKSCKFTKRARS